eukprot:366113-Chlamydomonas_euryale.AAC.7
MHAILAFHSSLLACGGSRHAWTKPYVHATLLPQEFDSVEDASLTPKERLEKQRKQLKKKLGTERGSSPRKEAGHVHIVLLMLWLWLWLLAVLLSPSVVMPAMDGWTDDGWMDGWTDGRADG